MNEISTQRFDLTISTELVDAFADFSHDCNPLHLNTAYARKTPFGEPICYGSLGVIALLARLQKNCQVSIKELRANFIGPVFIGQTCQARIEPVDNHQIECSLSQGEKILLHCTIICHDDMSTCENNTSVETASLNNGTEPLSPRHSLIEQAQTINIEQLQTGVTSTTGYQPDWSKAGVLWRLLELPQPAGLHDMAGLLALASYWIGMHTPGQQALFSAVTIQLSQTAFVEDAYHVQAEITHLDQQFALVQQQLTLTHGTQTWATIALDAFFRESAKTTNIAELMRCQTQLPSMHNKTVLVVGASRGLGASLAVASALAGAHVFANYRASSEPVTALLAALPVEVQARFTPCQADCTDAGALAELRNQLEKTQQKIDYLFFCATPPLHAMDPDAINDQAFQDYMQKTLAMTSTPLSAVKQNLADTAAMVYISSQVINQAVQDWPHYSAAKACLESWWQTLAVKHSKKHWFIVRPPQLATDLVSSFLGNVHALAPEQAALAILTFIDRTAHQTKQVSVMNEFPAGSGETIERDSIQYPKESDNRSEKQAEPTDVIAIAASFTLDPLADKLPFWLEKLTGVHRVNGDINFRLAPYNQVVQTLSLPNSDFYHESNKLNVLLLRLEDCLHYQQAWQDAVAQDLNTVVQDLNTQTQNLNTLDQHLVAVIEEQTAQWLDALQGYRAATPLMIITCADSPQLSRCAGYAALREQWQKNIESLCSTIPNVYHRFLSPPETDSFDPQRNRMAHIPYTENAYLALATELIRSFCAVSFSPVKVIVCDCDNTLWQGIVGEDGINGIELTPGHLRLQQHLKHWSTQGFLICLASKNNEADVLEVFQQRRDMPLTLSDIASHRINWSAKSENIRSLAAELNLGLDSFVFIDDNPMEIAEVSTQLPAVLSLPVKDDAFLQTFTGALWFTDKLHLSDEDRNRTRSYQDNRKRTQLQQQQTSLLSFIETLALDIQVKPVTDADIPRIAQLTNKTNQFNLTTLRLNENQVAAYQQDTDKACWLVQVSDKFGSYGTVGAMFVSQQHEQWQLDNLLLSCRVLGRGVEYALLNKLGEVCKNSLRPVRLLFTPSAKNQPAFEFLTCAFPNESLDKNAAQSFQIDARVLADITLQDQTLDETAPAPQAAKPLSDPDKAIAAQHRFYAELAESLHTRADIQQAFYGDSETVLPDHRLSQSDYDSVGAENSVWSGIEKAVRQAIPFYRERLQLDTEFEALGLSSLMVVNLTVALSQRFSFTLSDTFLYGLTTLNDLQNKLQQTLGDSPTATVSVGKTTESKIEKTVPKSKTETQQRSRSARQPEKIAIIGLAGRYPGADNLDEFWKNLSAGECSIEPVPGNRWDHSAIYSTETSRRDKSCSREGGFIRDHDCFDAGLFQISPKDAALMDPQQRWFLTIAYECMLAAGYNRKQFNRDAGVFVGAMAKDYQLLCAELVKRGEAPFPYTDLYQIANRVSYFLNLHGPSITVDTACSSSGVALHMACESLLNGECSVALAGGVNLILDPQRYIQYTQMGMLSPDARCRTFSDDAQGMVMGEGVGCVLLKPLSQAEADGDFIYATLIGTHTNSGGRTTGFTVPNPEAQAQLIETALHKAGIAGKDVSYLEAHGTGTPIGDPIEADGIAKALGKRNGTCRLGSVKTNIGHLEPAAAIASLTKVILQMQHRQFVPSLYAERLNHRIDFDRYQLSVQRKNEPWTLNPAQNRRIAGVSSFGAGGVNAHVLIEEYIPRENTAVSVSDTAPGDCLIPFSAREPKALKAMITRFEQYLSEQQAVSLAAIAHTLQSGRDQFRHRLVFVVSSLKQLQEQLSLWLREQPNEAIAGDIKQFKDMADLLEDSHLLMPHWVQQRDWKKIAAWWVKGATVDWTVCFQGSSIPARMPLPGYPFVGARHWLDGAAYQPVSVPPADSSVTPGAVPEQASVSDKKIAVTQTETDSTETRNVVLKREDYFVTDHCVAGEPILPGVSYLALFARDFAGEPIALENVLWLRPLGFGRLSDDQSYDHSQQRSQREVSVCVAGKGMQLQDTAATVYAKYQQSVPLSEAEQASADTDRLNLQTLQSALPHYLDKSACYQRLRQQGFDYGPRLQGIESCRFSETQALACLQRPQGLTSEPWSLVSALLDAGLQTAICVNHAPQALLPYSCQRVELFTQQWPATVYAFVDLQECRDERLTCHIRFVNDAGQTLLHMHELTLLASTTRSEKNNLSIETPRFSRQHIYVPVWESCTDEVLPNTMPSNAVAVNHAAAVNNRTVSDGELNLLLYLLPDSATLTELESHFMPLQPELHRTREVTCLTAPTVEDLAHYLESDRVRTAKHLLVIDLVSATVSEKAPLLPLHILKSNAADVRYLLAWVGEQPLGDAYAGLALSLAYETDKRLVKTLCATDRAALWQSLGDVLFATGGLQFRVQQSGLQRLQMQPFSTDSLSVHQQPVYQQLLQQPIQQQTDLSVSDQTVFQWQHNGTYWFTGLGGVACLLANVLIEQFDATIIFSGRRSPAEAQSALQNLPAQSVRYCQVDISDEHQCQQFWREMEATATRITGIIHTAGVTADQRLSAQSLTEFRRPLEAKITGTRNLLNLLNSNTNTWLLLCSSIASVVGNIGQTSYAMGNRYQDAIAHTRQAAGRVLTINWPLWQGIGMAAAGATDLEEHNRNAGLAVITPEDGFACLTNLLSLATYQRQLIYLPGDEQVCARLLNTVWNPPALVSMAKPALPAAASTSTSTGQPRSVNQNGFTESTGVIKNAGEIKSTETMRTALLALLFRHTYELLDLPEGILEEDEDLSDYGFDSISLAEFAERLNEELDLNLTPVIFFDHPTLGGLVDALLEKYEQPLAQWVNNRNATADSDTDNHAPLPVTELNRSVDLSESFSQQSISERSISEQPVSHLSVSQPSGTIDTATLDSGTIDTGIKTNPESVLQQTTPSAVTPQASESAPEPIAIIGLACRFPQSENSEAFWQHLMAGDDLVTPLTAGRWQPSESFTTDFPSVTPRAGLLHDIDFFDADFFKLSRREAILMDPQHRLLLELAWQAIEHSGYKPDDLSGQAVGVFTAVTLHDHLERLQAIGQEAIAHLATGNVHCLSANRISYLLNLKGPSEAVDTACSSSLVALNRAVKALRSGECKQALVGGVNALLSETMFEAFTRAGMLSSSGACHSFSANADGYVRGEGGGMLLLKPLRQAQADGDRILALVKGTAVNHVGHGQSLTAPSARAQTDVIKAALADARVNAGSLSYIEAHGTGTRLGDPIEIEGLTQAFAADPTVSRCHLGTVKTNMGHLESAAGIAGIIKVVLSMVKRVLPASLHGEPHNPYIQFASTPFRLLTRNQLWESSPRRAGVSSFGFGGVNGHVILEEYTQTHQVFESVPGAAHLILLSARSAVLLAQQLQALLQLCDEYRDEQLPAVARVSQHGREAYTHRFAAVVTSVAELRQAIGQQLQGISTVETAPVTPVAVGSDQALLAQLQQQVDSGQWTNLAGQWLAGLDIPWRKLQPGKPFPRVDFPLTAFARVDCGPHLLANGSSSVTPDARSVFTTSVVKTSVAATPIATTPLATTPLATTPVDETSNPAASLFFQTGCWQDAPLNTPAQIPARNTNTVLLLAGEQQILHWLPHIPAASLFIASQAETETQWLIVRADSLLPAIHAHEHSITDDLSALTPLLARVDCVLDTFDWPSSSFKKLPLKTSTEKKSSEFLQRHCTERVQLLQRLLRQRAGKPVQLVHMTGVETDMTAAWMGSLYAGLSAEYDSVHSVRLESGSSSDNAEQDNFQLPDFTQVQQRLSAELLIPEHIHEQLFSGQRIRYQGNRRQQFVYQSLSLPAMQNASLKNTQAISASQTYLITGGRGKIALQLAALLVREGAKHLLLLGRAPLSPDNQQAIEKLTQQGASVVYLQSLDTLAETLATQPFPLAGVLHCAGVDTQGELAFVNKSPETFVQCLQPKTGLAESLCQTLDRFLPQGRGSLDFFIALSSVAAIAPVLTAGRSDYGPANAALDQWIQQQAATYPQAGFVSLQLPSHQQGGMPVVHSPVYDATGLPHLDEAQTAASVLAVIQQLTRAGTDTLPPLLLPLGENETELSLYPELKRADTAQQLSEHTQSRASAPVTESGSSVAGSVSTVTATGTTQYSTENFQAVLGNLQNLFAERLLISAPIPPEKTFNSLGVDSILISDLVTAIERRFECVLPPSAILEHPTLHDLSCFLIDTLGVEMITASHQETPEANDPPVDQSVEQPGEKTFAQSVNQNTASATYQKREPDSAEKIAVIGMACRFPGAATISEFWDNLSAGRSHVVQVPMQRFNLQALYAREAKPGQSISQWAGLVDAVDLFDPGFFGIAREQAAFIDPLTRLSLLTAAEAIADAGYTKEAIWGSRTGVFMGGNRAHYGLDHVASSAAATGMNQNFIASHLSHVYNLTGPSFVVDSACSSSLLSLHLARQQLLAGEIDIALAGGAEVLLDETPFLKLSASGALSPDGRCHTFAAEANGFVPGEGAGTVVLKRLSDAIRQGDPIYGVIEASAVNNDGNTMGLTTPNIEAQQALLQTVYGQSQDSPLNIAQLGYWEAHGTATMIGDPIELKAISSVLRDSGAVQGQVALGSVKSNMGHLMGAAGIASFIKTMLVLHHRQIVPTLHCEHPNPRFRFDQSPVYPATAPQALPLKDGRALAGISAFGFGGTNCHLCCATVSAAEQKNWRRRLPLPAFDLQPFWLPTQRQAAADRAPSPASALRTRKAILSLETV